MVKVEEFAVEKWMDDHETEAKYNLGETCCSSLSIDQLSDLSENKQPVVLDLAKKLDYGTIRGSPALCQTLSGLYSARASSPLSSENVLITPGAIAANFIVLYALIGPGDHVICHYPTYQQLYSVPEALGAEVSLWKADPSKDWVPDVEELKRLVRPNTRLIIINNPNNPTGAILTKSLLHKIVQVAEPDSIPILCDEVYRPLFHSVDPTHADFPPSLLTLMYRHSIVTGSMSKAYSLAGIRVGWIASRSHDLIERCASTRHYSTISVSSLDQQVAAYALGPNVIHALLTRNLGLARKNLADLVQFLEQVRRGTTGGCSCEWVRPRAGTTMFVQFRRMGKPVDAVAFCTALMARSGALFLPGDYGFGPEWKGYVRIGFCAIENDVLNRGLEAVTLFLGEGGGVEDVPAG